MFIAYIAVSIFPFVIYGLINYSIDESGSIRGRKFTAIVEGLKDIGVVGIIICLLISASLILLVRYLMSSFQDKVKLIVEVDFNEDQHTISVTTKNANDKMLTSKINYDNLRFTNLIKQMDGIGHGEFSCVELSDGDKFIGRIYAEHFTWDKNTFESIEKKIKTIANTR